VNCNTTHYRATSRSCKRAKVCHETAEIHHATNAQVGRQWVWSWYVVRSETSN